MAARPAKDRETQDRLRQYQARQTVFESTTSRRRRDNLLAVLIIVVVAALATTAQVLYFTAGPGAPEPVASPSAEPTDGPAASAPAPSLSEFRTWTGELVINDEIPLEIELDGLAAPQAVASFVSLVQSGFYDGLSCHRLTTAIIFVLQCGDPAGDGTGGPDYRFGPIENPPLDGVYAEGMIAMARQSGDGASMGSQFFIVYDSSAIPADAAGGYTVLGRVTSGLDALVTSVIAAGTEGGATDGPPAVPTSITGITIQ